MTASLREEGVFHRKSQQAKPLLQLFSRVATILVLIFQRIRLLLICISTKKQYGEGGGVGAFLFPSLSFFFFPATKGTLRLIQCGRNEIESMPDKNARGQIKQMSALGA